MIRPAFVGLCGTDVELLAGTMPYYRTGSATMPLQPGHEFTAVVVESDDPSLAEGARVVGDPVIGCGACDACERGRPTHCADRLEIGVRGGMPGAAADLVTVPTTSLVPIPDTVPTRDAVLAEPAVTVLEGLARAGDPTGRQVLVIGAGTLGLIAAQCLLHDGADVAVAMRQGRRQAGVRAIGATPIVTDEGAPRLRDGFDIVIEAAGSPDAVNLGVQAVAAGGQLVLLGVPPSSVDGVDVAAVVIKDVTVHGVLNGPGRYRDALDRIAGGVIRPDEIIGDDYPLDRFDEALEDVSDRGRAKPKVLLRLPGADDPGVSASGPASRGAGR